jgi:membrane protease YdiL (CAAX protease family)
MPAAASKVNTTVAPWWHTAIVLLILAGGSVAGAHFHGLPRVPSRSAHARTMSYATAFVIEWLIVLLIWLGVRTRGVRLRDLLGERWQKPTAFLRDLGLAVLFLLVAIPCLGLVSRLLHASFDPRAITPTTPLQLVLWIALAATAGFCEELTFRGYLNRQFSGWSGSAPVGMVLQGVCFGLAHGYQGWRMMVVIAVFGWMFGALALWRRSLLPGMLAHGLQDGVSGAIGFFMHH